MHHLMFKVYVSGVIGFTFVLKKYAYIFIIIIILYYTYNCMRQKQGQKPTKLHVK